MDKHMLTINTLRVLSAEMVQKANSGHPGAPMGMAPMAYALWMHTLKHDPAHPQWANRDRFVLSNGHASALLYALLHLCGYPMPMRELERFRQWNSITPGHPEHDTTLGIETTTGPLGQGFANGVGFAIAQTMLAAKFNRPDFPLYDHRTYVFAGDGCMMEGITSEAASLAGTLKLSNLIVLYDDNEISIEGGTDLAFREDVGMRFEAYGWQVLRVDDGNDYLQVLQALEKSRVSTGPTLIICPTIIGFGSEAKQGTASAHGEPLGADSMAQAKKALGLTGEAFSVPQAVYDHVASCMEQGKKAYIDWQHLFAMYAKAYPELASEWEIWHAKHDTHTLLQEDFWWAHPTGKEATRTSSGNLINQLAQRMPNLVGGSADLAPSTKTLIIDGGDFSAENPSGRNLRFGVREHAMAGICNGIALHGGLRVFCATFFVFTDYMKASMRLAAIMNIPVTYVLTHDSIGLGEDGATHQPVEHLAALRATPNMRVIRPCDAKETGAAWLSALTLSGPTCLVLSRQNLQQFEGTGKAALKGGYVLAPSDSPKPRLILIATGSEVAIAMGAKDMLKTRGIDASVVSMPSMELFLNQTEDYKAQVLPADVRERFAIEAGASQPWYRFVGLDGQTLTMDTYGASAPADELFKAYGFTPENAASLAEKMINKQALAP